MALIKTLDNLRIVSVGDNVPQVAFATPETPGGGWQQRGYLNDWDTFAGAGTALHGGWQLSNLSNYGRGIANQIQCWYVVADPASGNTVRALVKYHVKAPRAFKRRRSNKTWEPAGGGGIMGLQYINDHILKAPDDDDRPAAIAPINATSGGIYLGKSAGWTLHGYPQPREPLDAGVISEYDAFALMMMARVVPHTLTATATDGYRWADSTAQLNVGADHFNGGTWLSEMGHSAFLQLTNRYKLFGMMTIRHPSMSPQPPGLTEAQFLESIFDWSLYPEEEVWIERGAFDSGDEEQTLVLRRTAPVATDKTFTLSVLKGTITLAVSQVVMSAGSNSVQFIVNTPGGAIAGQQVLYLTDGGGEDHWGDFEIGNGTSTGDPGGPGSPSLADTTRTNLLLRTTDLANAAWEKGDGSTVGTADGDGWQLVTSGTDYVQQAAAGFTAAEPAVFAIDAKPGNVDWALIRLGANDYSSGRFQFVNLATGALGFTSEYGSLSAAEVWTEALSPSGFRVCYKLTQPETTRRVSIRAVSGDQDWNPWTAGDTISVRRPQWQAGAKATNFIATTTAAVTRTLTAVAVASPSPVAAGAASTAVVTLEDDTSAPWDQYTPIELVSDFPTILAVTPSSAETDADGELTFTLAAGVAGDAELTATAAGIVSTAAAVTVGSAVAALDTPDAPDLTVINSDTIEVDVTSIDAAATHVDIFGRDLALPLVAPTLLISVEKADLPIEITDLGVNHTWRFQAQSRVGEVRSAMSATADATTYRLFVFDHIAPTAAVTGVRVAAGRTPVAGILPTEIFGYSDSAVIDPGPYTYGGDQVSRIVLQLTAQPAGGKIRDGDLCVMIGFKTITAGVSRFGVGLNYGAIVAEGP